MDNKTDAELVDELLLTIKGLNSKIEGLTTKVNEQTEKIESSCIISLNEKEPKSNAVTQVTGHDYFMKIAFGLIVLASLGFIVLIEISKR